ncbi:aminoglycoside phosphotransferase [Mycolicibacterium aromaticivorans JS19b1 = JCM 16368]|uniref:Aminoglycoside phosphotransferase n=1 Tax=Mycolicibacterium aromaticivorans JS19b1 = JCM 16368 TaxID=1440774 RepID=A0A064CEK1_9MYCO|nr:phosphotransferase [Mycolicibacterium aromaticivorans]KDE99054.1 aminoglycoside phosphotransferase [Mycolicibacterium aromaticivorans JS19b1 = JCM 16368]
MPGLPPTHEFFARAALPAYGRAGDTPLRLLSLSENATYLVEDDDPIVLRVHRPGYHSLEAIRSELAWMKALRRETSVLTPELIAARDGTDVVAAEVDGDVLHVDAVTFVAGCTAEDDPEAVGFDQLGRLTAVMHEHARNWTFPHAFTRFRWDLDTILGPDARWGNWRLAPGLTDDDRAVIQRAADDIAAKLTHFGSGPDRFGLVHADLRLANLMVDPTDAGAGITVIDFDDCGWSWYLADLGAAVSFIEDTPAGERIIAEWLTGYSEAGSLPADHLALVPSFVMLRRINLTAWIASHADADAAAELGDDFAPNTARLAQRYLEDRSWLQDAIFGSRV